MKSRIIEQAQQVFDIEAAAILDLKNRLDDKFVAAVEMIKACEGKIVLTGIGKSGHIARKIASTFSSTGTPAIFMHPAESLHGDLGVIDKKDIVMALSYGGEAAELSGVLNFITRKGIPLIAVTGFADSTLAKTAKIVLNVEVSKEACPLGLAPTASSTASLAMGDAVAMAVLREKGFSPENFAEYHPGGKLGVRLLTRVKDLMHTGEALPIVTEATPVKEIFSIMTHKDVRGAAGVVDGKGDLMGIITDGDIRRRLQKNQDPFSGTARDLMTMNPRTIDGEELAEKALFVMEQFKIQMLFVLDQASAQPRRPSGILHLQDLLRAKIR
jgi:arabinose-5-phosphate isomerase